MMVLNELIAVLSQLSRSGYGELPVEVYGLDQHPKPLVGIGSNGAVIYLGATFESPLVNVVPPPIDFERLKSPTSE